MRDKDKKHLVELVKTLEKYQEEFDLVEDRIRIKGKSLAEANQENASWQIFYDSKRAELSTLMKRWEAKRDAVHGSLFKKYTQTSNLDLSDRAKDKYIQNEEEYLEYHELYLEIKELHDKFSSAVDAFRSRGFALNNITKARVADVQDYTL